MAIIAEIDAVDPKKIKLSSDWKYKELISALPSSKYKDGCWYVNLTWQMYLALQTTFKSDLTIGIHLRQWHENIVNTIINPALELRQQTDFEGGYESLYPHQRAGVAFLSTIKRGILADDMGVGKSRTAFSTVRRLFELGENPFPVLISCPNSTKFGWEREVKEVWPGLRVTVVDGTATQRKKLFDTAMGEVPCVIHGEPAPEAPAKAKRKSKAPAKAPECTCKSHVVIINWESLRTHSRLQGYGSIALKKCPECGGITPAELQSIATEAGFESVEEYEEFTGLKAKTVTASACEAHKKELNKIEFQTVIGDEIHRIMDPSSKVSRAFKAATGNAPFRFGLSGTPIASSPEDLFSPLNWCFPEAYPSKTKYIDRMCTTTYNAWGATIVTGIKPEMEKEFFEGLDPFLRRMPKEVILPFLPPIIRERRDVEMGAKQKKAYEQMRDNMVADLDGELLITTSPLTKLTRLLQFAASYAEIEYRPVRNKETREIEDVAFVKLSDPSATLDAFMDDLPDFGDESLVVFAVSSQFINLLSQRMDKLKIPHGLITGEQDAVARQRYMDQFQKGEIKYILCTIAAGGTGITLTRASTMVFLQRSWSLIEDQQAEARAHRIGSEMHEVVRIIDYVVKDTVQQDVFEAVEAKEIQLEYVLRDEEFINKTLKGNKE